MGQLHGHDDRLLHPVVLTINTDPTLIFALDLFLTLRRNKPRPLPLVLVHGDFNPANFLYEGGRVTALIDWENSRIGDPREDLGWMTTMDILSNTNVILLIQVRND